MEYQDKWDSVFIQAYARDITEAGTDFKLYPTKIDLGWQNLLLRKCKNRIWIGLNHSSLLDEWECITIPNYYTFTENRDLVDVNTETIGYAARFESRKNPHWLSGHSAKVLTHKYDYYNSMPIRTLTALLNLKAIKQELDRRNLLDLKVNEDQYEMEAASL